MLTVCEDDDTDINLDNINLSKIDGKLNNDSVESLLENISEHIKIILDENRKTKHKNPDNTNNFLINSENKKSKNKIETQNEKKYNNIVSNENAKETTNIKEISDNINNGLNVKMDHRNTYNYNPKTFCGIYNSESKSSLKKEASFKLSGSHKNSNDILNLSRNKSVNRRVSGNKFVNNYNMNCSLNKSLKAEKNEFENKINSTKGNNYKYYTISQITGIKPKNNKMKKFYTKRKW